MRGLGLPRSSVFREIWEECGSVSLSVKPQLHITEAPLGDNMNLVFPNNMACPIISEF